MASWGESAVSREILHEQGFYPEESSGLFVGISTFEDDRFAPVRFAVDDAVDLAWVFSQELGLAAVERCVLALTGEPQKDVSRERLETMLSGGARLEVPRLREVYRLATELSQSGGSRGLFVLTAATHGLSEQGGDFLIAADSLRDRLLKTGIEVKDLFDSAATAIARRRLLLLDACRERLSQGTKSISDTAMSRSFAEAISKTSGLTLLSGSTVGGYSYDDKVKQNGVFTSALVEGLLGAAAADDRGFITVSTLADFAQEQVQAWVSRHRREHLGLSRGIEHRFDEMAKHLPLAIDPRRVRQLTEYQVRQVSALKQLRDNIADSEDAVITGELYSLISGFLPSEQMSSHAEELLVALENLDGSEPTQRALRDVWRDLREESFLAVSPAAAASSMLQETRESKSVPAQSPRLAPETTEHSSRWLVFAFVLVATLIIVWRLVVPNEVVPNERGQVDTGHVETGAVETVSVEKGGRDNRLRQPGQPDDPEAGDPYTDAFGQRFRWIPGGTYSMGSPLSELERDTDENQRKVEISGYWLAEVEMTQGFWKRMGLAYPTSLASCDECPVERVSWYDAVQLANILSSRVGAIACYDLSCTGTIGTEDFVCDKVELKSRNCKSYRLPLEAEWEVAARAQAPSSLYRARYGEIEKVAWYRGNSGLRLHPAGKKAPNAWQLRDLLGNVWEWTWDTYDSTGSSRTVRGGSWDSDATKIRAACRHGNLPVGRNAYLGFRLALGRAYSRPYGERTWQ